MLSYDLIPRDAATERRMEQESYDLIPPMPPPNDGWNKKENTLPYLLVSPALKEAGRANEQASERAAHFPLFF